MAYNAGDLQVGLASEGSWNASSTTINKWIEVTGETVKASYDRVEAKGLRTQRILAAKDKFTKGKVDVNGDLEFEWLTNGQAFLLEHMLGSSVTTTTVVSGVKKHSYSLTAGTTTDGKGLAAQIVRTDVAGARQPFTYSGLKVSSWEISAQQGEVCQGKLTLNGANETVGGTAATPTYIAGTPLVYAGAAITVGGSSFEVKSVSVKGENMLKADRYVLGSNIKKEQVQSGVRTITGTLGVEFNDVAAYNRVVNASVVSFQAKFESLDAVTGSTKASLTITMPDIRFEGETPTGGGQIIEHNLNFMALDDETSATSPCTIDYVTTDTTP
jgi:hypothetical protein